MTLDLTNFDASHWLTKDKGWMAERNAQWPAIERVVGINRKKPEVNVIRQYFLRGKMPNWQKYLDWDDIFRPLDLNMFLWLHPSSDVEVLRPLYRIYMESDLVHPRDVISGYGSFIGHELVRATAPYKTLEEYPFPFMGAKNIILFRTMFEDIDYAKSRMRKMVAGNAQFEEEARQIFEFLGFEHFLRIRRWLLHDSKSPLSENCLYQYDDVIDWVLTTITRNTEAQFRDGLETPEFVASYQKALYCIYHFDIDKEGDTGRAQFIRKIRKILDEHEFIGEFKQIWEDVKAGKVEVRNPWKI